MVGMATWEDGPEYAPLERPAEFTAPAVQPLDVAPPPPPPAELPDRHPAFAEPPEPVAPLAALVPAPADDRDPTEPFAVVSSNLTSGSAWGSAHQVAPLTPTFPQTASGPAPAPLAAAPGWPAAAATPWPAEGATPGPQGFPTSGPFPAPGTPQWFGPGPYQEQPAEVPIDARHVLQAATPGLLVVLAIGAIIFVLSPLMLVVAYALSSRVTAAQSQVRRALGIALAALGFIGLLGLGTLTFGFGEWWTYIGLRALLVCWLMLAIVTALVYRGLKQAQPPRPRPLDWR